MLHELLVGCIKTEMDSCRICIIGRLRTVYMVVWRTILILAGLVSHYLESTIGYDFICIHVCSRSRSTLDHIYRELIVELAFKNLMACLCDSLVLFVCQEPQLVVGDSSAKLGHSQSVDKQRVITKVKAADREIFNTPESLDSIKSLDRNIHSSYEIALNTCLA